jgi:hypothetical protein
MTAEIAIDALAYTSMGWAVFPLHPVRNGRCACAYPDCDAAGKHPIPTRWQNTISSPLAVAHLWPPGTRRGIGLATGRRSGVLAVDVDPRHGGADSLTELEQQHGELPETWRSRTGGGGEHILLAANQEIRNSAGRLAPGLDIRGDGGFIVLPPSEHVSGQQYEWIHTPASLAAAPDWLLDQLSAPRQHESRGTPITTGTIAPGQRHTALIRFCGLLRSMGLGEAAIVECGHALLRHHCAPDPPMNLAHAERTMRDIARRYPPTAPS